MTQFIRISLGAALLTVACPAQDRFLPLRKDHLPPAIWDVYGHVAFDLDQDGDLDLLEFDRFVTPRILVQTAPGQFTKGAQPPLTTGPSSSRGGGAADLDGDGTTDVLVLPRGYGPVRLFLNQGGRLVPAPNGSLPQTGGLPASDVPIGDLDDWRLTNRASKMLTR